MRKMTIVLMLVTCCVLSLVLCADQSWAAATHSGHTSARKQLGQLVQQLQQYEKLGTFAWSAQLDKTEALRKRIIELARKLKPMPAIPPQAQKDLIVGATLIKEGTTLQNAFQGLQLFSEAGDLAPWLSDAYWNAALAADLAGMYKTEKWDLKYYLLLKPSDNAAVQKRLDEIEAKQMIARSGSPADGILGYWQQADDPNAAIKYDEFAAIQITTNGNTYQIVHMGSSESDQVTYTDSSSIRYTFNTEWAGKNYITQVACTRDGNKLTCHTKNYFMVINGSRNYDEAYIHRTHCELVSLPAGGSSIDRFLEMSEPFPLCK